MTLVVENERIVGFSPPLRSVHPDISHDLQTIRYPTFFMAMEKPIEGIRKWAVTKAIETKLNGATSTVDQQTAREALFLILQTRWWNELDDEPVGLGPDHPALYQTRTFLTKNAEIKTCRVNATAFDTLSPLAQIAGEANVREIIRSILVPSAKSPDSQNYAITGRRLLQIAEISGSIKLDDILLSEIRSLLFLFHTHCSSYDMGHRTYGYTQLLKQSDADLAAFDKVDSNIKQLFKEQGQNVESSALIVSAREIIQLKRLLYHTSYDRYPDFLVRKKIHQIAEQFLKCAKVSKDANEVIEVQIDQLVKSYFSQNPEKGFYQAHKKDYRNYFLYLLATISSLPKTPAINMDENLLEDRPRREREDVYWQTVQKMSEFRLPFENHGWYYDIDRNVAKTLRKADLDEIFNSQFPASPNELLTHFIGRFN